MASMHVYLGWQCHGLTGPLPANWSSIASLRHVTLSGHNLSGNVPESWGSLQDLSSDNSLTGSMLEAFYDSRFWLVSLNVSNNRLTRTLPDPFTMASFGGQARIDLSNNSLSGSLPQSFGSLTHYGTFDSRGPPELKYGLPMVIDQSKNHFTGSLPEAWGLGLERPDASSSVQLDCSNNMLTGTLPGFWWSITHLSWLNVSTNRLSGSLPDSWRHLTHLAMLDASNNSIIGSLPAAWKTLLWVSSYRLTELRLSSNSLTGNIPDTATDAERSYDRSPQSATLALDGNHLSGQVSSIVSHVTDLSLSGTAYFPIDGCYKPDCQQCCVPYKQWSFTNLTDCPHELLDTVINIDIDKQSKNRNDSCLSSNDSCLSSTCLVLFTMDEASWK